MIICGIINELASEAKPCRLNSHTVLSYFFCHSTDSRTNTATALLRGLLHLIIG